MRQTLLAPAKLTLSLRMTGLRDDGFHLIDAEMVTLDLHDTLVVEQGGSGLTVVGGAADVPTGPSNLVAKALVLAGCQASVQLTKRIPSQAGLGGGSSDAGAVLRWLEFGDLEAAASLGADVAFCLVGGRARVTGIGEIVESLPYQALDFTLVTPAIPCPTPAIYRIWDDMGGPTSRTSPNDLEAAAVAYAPDLARVRDTFGDATGQTPVLAGSGSTWFVPGHFPGEGRVLASTTPAGWTGA